MTLLHSIGVERVILLVHSETELPDSAQASSDTLTDFLGHVVEQSQSMPAMLCAVRNLVAGVRVVADSVVGVATLVPAYGGIPAEQRKTRRRSALRLMPPSSEMDEASETPGVEAVPMPNRSALLLVLADTKDGPPNQRRAEVLSRLYGWVTKVMGTNVGPLDILEYAYADKSDWQAALRCAG